MNKLRSSLLGLLIILSSNISGQSSDQETSSWWDTTKKFLDDSQKNITDRVGKLNKSLDEYKISSTVLCSSNLGAFVPSVTMFDGVLAIV